MDHFSLPAALLALERDDLMMLPDHRLDPFLLSLGHNPMANFHMLGERFFSSPVPFRSSATGNTREKMTLTRQPCFVFFMQPSASPGTAKRASLVRAALLCSSHLCFSMVFHCVHVLLFGSAARTSYPEVSPLSFQFKGHQIAVSVCSLFLCFSSGDLPLLTFHALSFVVPTCKALHLFFHVDSFLVPLSFFPFHRARGQRTHGRRT